MDQDVLQGEIWSANLVLWAPIVTMDVCACPKHLPQEEVCCKDGQPVCKSALQNLFVFCDLGDETLEGVT